MEETGVMRIQDKLKFDISLFRTELIKMRYAPNIFPQHGCWKICSQNKNGDPLRQFKT